MSASMQEAIRPHTVEHIQQAIHELDKLLPLGGNTKPGLGAHRPHATPLHLGGLAGIVEYDPAEYTITAQAGTRLAELAEALAQYGQYLPFDPPWLEAGATLGGTIAAGVSGSLRQRYGSLRDFLIGVRFVDGLGRLVRGGGKVVKNAAGFDLPKMMFGSRGEFGILVEASLKVFPAPQAYGALTLQSQNFQELTAFVSTLARSHFDLYVLDVFALPGQSYQLSARLGGAPQTLEPRLTQLQSRIGQGTIELDAAQLDPQTREMRELTWVADDAWLIKCAITQNLAAALETRLTAEQLQWTRHYTNGLNSLWLSGNDPLETVNPLLCAAGIGGIVLRTGQPESAPADAFSPHYPAIGLSTETVFHRRIRETLDPNARFRG